MDGWEDGWLVGWFDLETSTPCSVCSCSCSASWCCSSLELRAAAAHLRRLWVHHVVCSSVHGGAPIFFHFVLPSSPPPTSLRSGHCNNACAFCGSGIAASFWNLVSRNILILRLLTSASTRF
uniref:Uncharacterized protein n=1 Tax=Physcomitrium patens TaxID=3218 RepID=A0A2K1IEF3_PHYPA|nr:hypothetical protein PHYPA_029807 [Physcomitrium patens]